MKIKPIEFDTFMTIKQFRKRHHLSQRQLADLLKVNYRTVGRWETGQRQPHESVFELLKRIDTELQESEVED